MYKKLVTVEKAVSGGLSASSFRRPLRESTEERQQMMVICETIQLTDGADVVQWQLDGKVFTVSSLYQKLKTFDVPFAYKFLTKVNVPERIEVFFWLLLKNSILTKDNLKCRGSIQDLMFDYPVAQYTWQVVRRTLDLKNCLNSIEDLFGRWRDSFPADDRPLLMLGCGALRWAI